MDGLPVFGGIRDTVSKIAGIGIGYVESRIVLFHSRNRHDLRGVFSSIDLSCCISGSLFRKLREGFV